MPLITRNSQNANVRLGTTSQLNALTFTDGDLASDVTLNKVKVFNGVSLEEIGATSFSSSAVVSQSTTIGDYTTPTAAVSSTPLGGVEYLVIAGGGAGQNSGGGAGGFRTATGYAVTAQTYSITVGAGGATAGANGADSVFSTITSTGGGGGTHDTGTGKSGGSGGGGAGSVPAGAGNTPSTSPSQGNNGGAGIATDPKIPHGGGGGAGSVGGDAPDVNTGGNGGAGTSSNISGSSVCYAGGGGGSFVRAGGTGGSATCGGGAGGITGTAGTANSGGGGGGYTTGGTFGAGGSGIVILRYLTSLITATGGTITTDGDYTIHTFTSSGSFVVSEILGANLAIDDDTATKWTSDSESNPNIYVDMGSALNLCATAFYFDSTDTTNSEILIQSSPDASVWTTRRTITESDLTNGAYNYYRFNIAGGARYIRFYGNTAGSTVLSIWEIKILKKTDSEIFNDLGILTITASDTALGPDGT